MPLDTRSAALARHTKRPTKTGSFTSVAATGVCTVAAGFLDDLQPGDILIPSALTGGSGLTSGNKYYVGVDPANVGAGGLFDSGETTCIIHTDAAMSTPATHTTNVTAGTFTKGSLNSSDDGAANGNYVSPRSARGR